MRSRILGSNSTFVRIPEYIFVQFIEVDERFWKELECDKKYPSKQECIPVGCIPSGAVAVFGGRGGGICLPAGVSVYGGCVCLGVCLSMWVVSAMGEGGYTPPPDRILDTRLWKHYLSAATVFSEEYAVGIRNLKEIDSNLNLNSFTFQ